MGTFYKLGLQMGTKRLKKTEKLFLYKCVLELKFETINGLGETSCLNPCTLIHCEMTRDV